ncbi:MAG: hypothetical protein HUU01_09970 [Saprospiraceae bacterium]|nr:hypothetical protein [Saprospiraceae bacterium]
MNKNRIHQRSGFVRHFPERWRFIFLSLGVLWLAACKEAKVAPPIRGVAPEQGIPFLVDTPQVSLQSGLYQEIKPGGATHFNYSADNMIYGNGSNFTYAYVYIENKDSLLFTLKKGKPGENALEWDFTAFHKPTDSTITQIKLTPEIYSTALGAEYPQTPIRYDYWSKENILIGGEMTGLVENHKNVWMHPPREFLFKILQLNPFPFIQAPYEVGNTWEGELVIGSHWRDKRWRVWEKSVKNKFQYKITDQVIYQAAIGSLECFVVEATGKSELGVTRLKAWFNPSEGFVQLAYQNINGSELVLNRVW